MNNDQAICFTTPEDIAFVRVLAWKAALSIEVRTGMKHSRVNVLKAVKQAFGFKGNKARVLEQLTEYVEARLPAKVQA
jgi:hypothetical protein